MPNAQIPLSVNNPQTSTLERATQLQGAQQQNQRQQFQMQELLRKQGVMRDLQASVGKYDLSSPSGRAGFTNEAMSKDISTGLELASSFGQLGQQEQKLQEQKDSVLASGLYTFSKKLEGTLLKGPGKVSPEEAQGLTQEWQSFVKSAYDNGLIDKNRIPPQSIPGKPDMGFIHTALMSTQSGRDLLSAERADREQFEKERHNRALEAKGGGRWLASQDEKGNPTWVWAPNPGQGGSPPADKPPGVGGSEVKPTGPAVPGRAPGARPSAVTQRYNQRSITAGAEVVRGLKMIDQMPIGQTGPVFQKYHGDGIISAPLKALTTTLTDKDAIDYNTAFSGMALELTTLLRNGMNINETEIKGIEEGARAVPGDSVGNVLYKIANVAAKARTALDSFEPTSDQQRKERDQLLQELDKWPDPEQVYAKMRGQKVPPKQKAIIGTKTDMAPETSQTVEDQADDYSHLWEGR